MTKQTFTNAAAFAIHNDTWAGERTVALLPFRTKRRGETVTRFRWVDDRGQSAGGFAAPFVSPERAVAAVARHACFRDAHIAA